MQKRTKNFSVGLLVGGSKGLGVLEYFLRFNIPVSMIICLVGDPHEALIHEKMLALAKKHKLPAYTSKDIKPQMYEQIFLKHQPDIVFVVGWRYKIPAKNFSIPKRGMYVLHDSLLPKFRGFAPVNWALISGETLIGATLFEIAEGIDNGSIVGQRKIRIGIQDDAGTLEKKMEAAYLFLIKHHLPKLIDGSMRLRRQNEQHATYTCKRLPEDGIIDWHKSTKEIFNFIRALTHPYPGAFSFVENKKMFVWQAKLPKHKKSYVGRIPGRVVGIENDGVEVLTGNGSLVLTRVQWDGKAEQDAKDVLRSMRSTLR